MQPLFLALALSFQPVPLDSESTYDLKAAKLEGKWSTVGGVPYKNESRGLRVTAAGKPGADVEGGATLAVAIFNDFEIIVGYELLGPARPASGSGAGAVLAVGTASTPQTLARFARLAPPTGASGLFTAVGAAGGKEIGNPVAADASSRKGRLKLHRRLSTLTFSHAEGDSATFKTIRETTFVKADVSSLSLLARGAGGAGADVLFTELVVRTAPPPGSTIVQTIQDRRVAGPLVSVEGGKLRIGAVPPRDFDLADLALVEIGSGAALRPRWVGQVDKDFVGTTARRGKNGIQDVQLVLSGLASGKEIVQLRLTVETAEKPAIYMLDTTKGPSWRLDLQRTGLSSAADVYLEPYEGDMFGKPITVTVTYSDGMTGSGSCKATTPTDHKRKIGAAATATAAKAGAPPPRMRAVVHLSSGDKLSGEIAKWDEKGVTLAPEWGGEILLPTDSLAALRPLPAIALVDKDFEERRKSPLAEDVAFVKNREDKLDNVAGKVVGLADGKLRFLYQGQERSLASPRVLAVVFAARPKPRGAFDAYQSFELASGDLVTGKWLGMADGRQRIDAPWNPKFNLPSESIRKVNFHNGKLVRLSDLAPAKVEEVGFFDRVWPYQRDLSLAGEPLKLKGAPVAKGIAVHSKSALAYDLGGGFTRFKATVGFDEAVAPVGRVLCRITGDGKELFKRDDLRADADPVDVDLSVAGVKQLVLEIDFGADEDAGDRVIWADPRLFR